MSDFIQTGSITTLHLLGEHDIAKIEQEIEEASKMRPISLVLPCLISEMDGPALRVIMSALAPIRYLHEVIVTLGPASQEEYSRACEFFRPLEQDGRRVRLIWNSGERIKEIYRDIEEAGLAVGPDGKGRSAWMAYGYVVARAESYIIALHDCDILSFTRIMLDRLVYPTVMPDLDYEFCKGYYSRVTDRLHGRVTRLLVTPLIRALTRILGELPLLTYYGSFRYPLAGEFSMIADLARLNRIPADWGLEVGVLAEVFRNCSLSRVCQVELCENYDHKHQDLSQTDPARGLNRMAIDVCSTIFRVLCSSGVVFGSGFFDTLRATFLREAQDIMAMYHADARINGLHFDRHAEAIAFETFAHAIRIAGDSIRNDPLGTPPIPNWTRVLSAIPGFASKLIDAVEADNRGAFRPCVSV